MINEVFAWLFMLLTGGWRLAGRCLGLELNQFEGIEQEAVKRGERQHWHAVMAEQGGRERGMDEQRVMRKTKHID